jgi:chromosome segregation ATPase
MSSEALVIAALGFLGALLSFAGLRLSAQLRQLRNRLMAELEVREKLLHKLNELDAVRGRAVEARDAAEGFRREVTQAKSDISVHKEQIERLKVDLLRANAVASDGNVKRGELEAKIAELTAAADAAQSRLHDHADLVTRVQDEAGARGEQVAKLEKQLQEAQRKVTTAQAESMRLSKLVSKAETDARSAGAASETGLRALQAELERAKASLVDADTKHKSILEAISDEARVLREDLDQVKAKLGEETKRREEAELRAGAGGSMRPGAALGSVPPQSGTGAVLAALDADGLLNRGQRETIRMMYEKFTAKTGKV